MIKSGSFTFNGKSSEDFGLVIQTPPVYTFPERDITVTHIPGRNGDIAVDNKCFKNTTREYSVAVWYMPGTGYYDNFEKILGWLNSAKGSYSRLEDTYDPEVYRKATFHFSGSFTDYYSKAGAINIQFDCKPQRYLKSGDEPTDYNGPIVEISSKYDYVSLPYITVVGVNTDTTANLDKVLMMSVSNDTEMVERSIITFQKYSGNVTIDSDEQTVTSSDNRDIYGNINLNGTPFPKFGKGTNKIEFKKYTLESTRLDSYNSKLTESQKTVSSEYKVYAAIQRLKQESFFIRKYDSLLSSKQESYLASSLQSLIDSKSESYTFQSFNTLLNNYGSNYTFTGTAADNKGTAPDWLTISDNNGTVKAVANKNGFYRVDAEDKKLRFVAKGNTISSTLKPNNINSILYYESVDEGDEHKLKVGYTDLPDWLAYDVKYDTDGSPSKVIYQIKYRVKEDGTTVINGYYWTDKTWLFGKAQWNKTVFENKANIDLASVSWSTSKKAFVNMSGISVSTTSTFTYKFYEGTTMPEYEPVKKETLDDNGVKHTDITNAVHFSVSSSDGSLSKVTLTAKDAGFYKVIPDKGAGGIDHWKSAKKDDTLTSGIDGTVAFEVGYVKEAPDYSSETTKDSKWPAWLESKPYISVNGKYAYLSPSDYTENSKIVFKITQPGYYRISSGSSDDTPKAMDDWVYLTAGKYTDELITKLGSNKVTSTDEHYIYRLETKVEKPDNNRVFMYRDEGSTESTMHNDPPSWLKVNYLPEDVTSSLTQETNGYIDSNGAIVQTTDKPKSKYSNYYSISNKYRYYIGASVNTISITNSISITYAIYDDSKNKITVGTNDTNKELILDNLSDNAKYIRLSTPDADVNPITLKQEQIDGTPNRVSYIANDNGYYRYDSNQVWTKHKTGDSIMPAISGKDDTMIYFLKGELPEVAIDESFAGYLMAEIIQDGITSNPTEVKFVIKEAGYYRYNNIVNWKYYNPGDTLFTSKINESSTVCHLKATNDDLSNLKITIKPRWWML